MNSFQQSFEHSADRPGRPVLSVVTVCYNPGPIILEAIRSVHAQDYAAIEHIIIDGGSKDGSVDLIRRHIRDGDVLVSEPDNGIYDAMNKGIALATGAVVAILNADDRYAHSGVISSAMEIFRRQDVDCVLADVAFFARNPQHIVRRYRSAWFKPSRIPWGLMPAHPAMFVRRTVYERLGLYRTDYQIAADFEFVVRAFGKDAISYAYLPNVFVLMAVGGVSTRGARARKIINRECVRACRENGIYTNLAMIGAKYPFKLLELIR